ncbi:MAG: hypothetical protein M3068_06395 [Gemmatimonadota bacterium]|nr:hypothetical protein [Gemmatimonadota bacterium]
MTHPLGIPELAGLASYRDAARIGFGVEENVRRLLRLQWVEQRLMRLLVAHLPGTAEWEVKCALALQQWQCAEHADALRCRIVEMRNPAPPLDEPPDTALDVFLDELSRCRGTVELVAGVHRVALPALASAHRHHLAHTNPLVDHPTCRILRVALQEWESAVDWGERALAAMVEWEEGAADRAAEWTAHLSAYLDAAGGLAGDSESPSRAALPPARDAALFVPAMHPRRDARFDGLYHFDFPPHVVYNAPDVPADERTLALLCKRALEMDVPEMMASVITERADQPWQFYLDYSRQLWDEARHAMMGTVALEARGVDWMRIPLNIGFALRLNLHATAVERQTMLYAIEQSLMPGDTGKRYELETALEAHDELAAHFQDYDWADEVLHARIGRRAMQREGISRESAMLRAKEIHERTWAALDRYRHLDDRGEWWGDFVRAVLGRESAAPTASLGDATIITE